MKPTICRLCGQDEGGAKVWCDCGAWQGVAHENCLEAWFGFAKGRLSVSEVKRIVAPDVWGRILTRAVGLGSAAGEIVHFLQKKGEATKLLFVNDGPGLLAGAMWKKYAELEELWPFKIQVNTLKMLPKRLSLEWLYS